MAGKMLMITLLLGVCATAVLGNDCSNLTGAWYNQLGSEMILRTDGEDPQALTGEYRTAVEQERGSAGKLYSNITGLAPKAHVNGEQSSSVFGFTVQWRDGNSTTAWLAQCLVCGGVERIVTTWILRTSVDSCTDKWRAVMTGRDFFTRQEQKPGPRKHQKTHNPSDHKRHGLRRGRRDLRYVSGSEDVVAPIIQSASVNVARPKELDVNVDVLVDAPKRAAFFQADRVISSRGRIHGLWFNELGSEMSLHHLGSTTIRGSYKTVSERLEENRSNGTHSEILGLGSPLHRDTTMSLLMSWNNGDSMTAWVGQVHMCTETNRPVEVLEAAFLHRSKINQCQSEWKATIHGHTTFTRSDPFNSDGEHIAVREFGEEEQTC